MQINKIYNMDAIKGLKEIKSESVDIVLVDPPYNIGKDFGNNKYKKEISEYISWCNEWITECVRIMKPTGTMYIYGFSEILAHISVNLDLEHRWLIWHYTNKTVPSLNFWQRSHESILCAWKDKKKRIFNRDDVREPYTDKYVKDYHGKERKRTKSKGRFTSKKSDAKDTVYTVNEKGALPRDVLKVSSLAGGAGRAERVFYCRKCGEAYHPKEMKHHKDHEIVEKKADGSVKMVSAILKHPTQKPQEVTNRLLKACMPKEGGVVVIPFVGSGGEVLTARKLGLNYIGFELNEEYFKLINFFIENEL